MSPSDTYKKKTSRNGQEQHEKFSCKAVSLIFLRAIGKPLDTASKDFSFNFNFNFNQPDMYFEPKTIAYKFVMNNL